jgi:hypothetical protein
MKVSGELHDPTTLAPRGKSPQYPSDRMLGGPELALDAMEKKKLAQLGIKHRTSSL